MTNINRKPICRSKSISLKNHKKNRLIKATTFRLTHNYWNIYWDWNQKRKCFSYVSVGKEKTLVNFWFTRVYFHLFVPRPGIEPGWKWIHWCLRPTRLPIPPSGRLRLSKFVSQMRCKGSALFLNIQTFSLFFFILYSRLFHLRNIVHCL